jgi:hypothetical protein
MELDITKSEVYKTELHELTDWDEYLLKESGLPGPRGNIELAQVVADEGNCKLFECYHGYTAEKASTNSP